MWWLRGSIAFHKLTLWFSFCNSAAGIQPVPLPMWFVLFDSALEVEPQWFSLYDSAIISKLSHKTRYPLKVVSPGHRWLHSTVTGLPKPYNYGPPPICCNQLSEYSFLDKLQYTVFQSPCRLQQVDLHVQHRMGSHISVPMWYIVEMQGIVGQAWACECTATDSWLSLSMTNKVIF